MSIRPNCCLTSANTCRIWSRFVTSILTAVARRPIWRISSAVALEYTQPWLAATWASIELEPSAVVWRFGSSSSRMSVMTTSAPCRASVSASSRPRPREAPVTTATFPVRSNMRMPPWEPGTVATGRREPASLHQLGNGLRDHWLTVLVDGRQPHPPVIRLAPERHGVRRPHHAGEAAGEPAQPARLSRDAGQQSHLQHAVGDDAREPDRAGEVLVQVDGVGVARRLGVGGDLLPREGHDQLAHEPALRITNSARERHRGAPAAVTSVSSVSMRTPRRST